MKTSLSFIVVNYQSRDFLERCLASIYKQSFACSYEIIIVNNDNYPLDGFLDKPFIKIINNNKNVGFGRACNLGARSSQNEFLFFLNPDAEILSAKIDTMLNFLKKNEKAGLLAPKMLSAHDTIEPWSAGREITPLSIILNNVFKKNGQLSMDPNTLFEFDWVSGGCFIISKKFFLTCGGFDEKFFLYFEDVDLCKKIRSLGKKVFIFPQFNILHLGGKSFLNTQEQKGYYYQSQDYYLKKHFGNFWSFVIRFLRKIFI
ncbi:MAG TPA: glycosyltransferase family 2 protein [Candidatus Moranbacteria bacterium]|nr:glycosyltransferase family 2 protein [Candidatus Moranbacteria bacterium]